MPARKPLVLSATGRPEELPAGDTLAAAAVEVDQYGVTNADSVTMTLGMVGYMFSAANVKRAMANAAATAEAIGLVAANIAAGAAGTIITNGVITGLTGLVAGSTYFLDPATPGAMTVTPPTTAGQYVVELGKALSTTEFLIRIREPILRA